MTEIEKHKVRLALREGAKPKVTAVWPDGAIYVVNPETERYFNFMLAESSTGSHQLFFGDRRAEILRRRSECEARP